MVDRRLDNQRIAKNTALLSFRMLCMTLIALYTSRVVLTSLGIENYGIYNVVGGGVIMFSMISGALTASINRFITFELGRGDMIKLRMVFSTSIMIQLLLGFIIVLLSESIGVWFLNEKMVIPQDRLNAANWVLQFSIITFVINLISVPYNAVIIAHERMSAFAYISIIEVVGKLMIAYFIMISPMDKLIFYAITICLLSFVIRIIYGFYCKKNFEECSYHFIWNKEILKNMFSFASWNMIGASSAIFRDQGGNIVINLFCGPAVNAARGIAFQVNSAIQGFVQSFMTALNPQITKSYASGDTGYMINLLYKGARFSFYILLFISLPIIVNTEFILSIWLGLVPDHTVLFIQLVLMFALSECISMPLITAMYATGNVRNYQIVVGGLQMMNLPISYIALHMGAIPESVVIVAIIISQICLITRLIMLNKTINLNLFQFISHVYLNILVVFLVASALPLYIMIVVEKTTVNSFIFLLLLCIITSVFSILYLGCNTRERKFIYEKALNILLHRHG